MFCGGEPSVCECPRLNLHKETLYPLEPGISGILKPYLEGTRAPWNERHLGSLVPGEAWVPITSKWGVTIACCQLRSHSITLYCGGTGTLHPRGYPNCEAAKGSRCPRPGEKTIVHICAVQFQVVRDCSRIPSRDASSLEWGFREQSMEFHPLLSYRHLVP